MASIKVILWEKKKTENEHPIVIRITKDRKSTYLYTGQYVAPKYWDETERRVKSTHPNATILNQLILKKLAEANGQLLESEIKEDYESISTIKRKITGKKKTDFFIVADQYLDNLLKSEKYRQYNTQKNRIKKFKTFVGKQDLAFREISVALLRKFETYLLHEDKKAPRTVVNYLMVIRTVYNRAISDSQASKDLYPFGKGKIQIKFPQSEKIGLSIDEVKLLENSNELSPPQQHAVNLWLLSFYFAGIRFGDLLLLKWDDFKDERLYYRMNKNQKYDSLKIPEKAKAIMGFYSQFSNKNNLVFPDLGETNLNDKKALLSRTQSVNRNINRTLQRVADNLKINKKLSMHIARHTFGNISGDRIPIQMLQKLYRHSSVTTTINYQANFMKKEADTALDKVINF
ncbi:phage integrase SAM-like domain-containing protein [Galbibacter sp. BG1]